MLKQQFWICRCLHPGRRAEVSRSGWSQTHQACGVHGHYDRLLLLSSEQLQGNRKHETFLSSCDTAGAPGLLTSLLLIQISKGLTMLRVSMPRLHSSTLLQWEPPHWYRRPSASWMSCSCSHTLLLLVDLQRSEIKLLTLKASESLVGLRTLMRSTSSDLWLTQFHKVRQGSEVINKFGETHGYQTHLPGDVLFSCCSWSPSCSCCCCSAPPRRLFRETTVSSSLWGASI